MTTIREKLIKWRDEDVDADTHITDQEIDILEKIVCEITSEISSDYRKIIRELK